MGEHIVIDVFVPKRTFKETYPLLNLICIKVWNVNDKMHRLEYEDCGLMTYKLMQYITVLQRLNLWEIFHPVLSDIFT